MKWKKLWFILLIVTGLVGCTSSGDQMNLLDEPLREVKISHFQYYDGINEDYFRSFESERDVEVFKLAITTAVKKQSAEKPAEPDYDLAVVYNSKEGELPTHGIHMWTGEQVKFMYIADEEVYETTPEMSEKLMELLK